MYIESKLKGTGKTLFSVDLTEENLKQFVIKREVIEHQKRAWFSANCKIQYTADLFIVDTHFCNDKTLIDLFNIEGPFIKISYLSKGESFLIHPEKKEPIAKGCIQCCFAENCNNSIEMPSGEPTHYCGVLLSLTYFLNLLEDEPWINKFSFYEKVSRGEFVEWGSLKYPISYKLYHILSEITQSDWDAETGKFYINLRLKELFLGLYISEQQKEGKNLIEGNEDNFKKVQEAHAYLVCNFKNPPTIKVLSRMVLLNELQLKKDFKRLYGKTIRSFIIDLRMQKAKSLVGEFPVGEVAGILGYKSVPHFINSFKKYYGYTPKQGLNQ